MFDIYHIDWANDAGGLTSMDMFVIAGVTGNTGSVVASTLLDAGKKVRVLVRDAKKGAAWAARGAEVAVVPTLDDAAALTTALKGATGAYLLSPPDVKSNDFVAERNKTFEAMAKAIDASGVAHVVFLSSIGAQHAKGVGPIATVHFGEERLAKTGAKLTFVRAGSFLENFGAVAGAAKAGKLPTFVPADLKVPTVTTRDIGTTAAKALLEGPPTSKVDIIELATGEWSARDVAAFFAKALNREVAVEEHPLDAVIPVYTSFGISPHIAGLFREMYEGEINGTVAFEGGKARRVKGDTDPATVIAALVS